MVSARLLACIIFFLLPQLIAAHTGHPLGKKQLKWDGGDEIVRTLSMNFDFHGGDAFVIWRRPGRIEMREGKSCLVGPYFFFDVDDNFAFDIDETVTLDLLVDRSATDGFNLSYDHAINPAAKNVKLPDHFDTRWETISVTLERARFANRKYGRTDFAIGALGAKHPQDKSVNGELVVCGITVHRNSKEIPTNNQTGILSLRVTDSTNRLTTVRVGLYAADGRAPLPGNDAVTLHPHETPFKQWPLLNRIKGWPSEGQYVFYVDGNYVAKVPEGEYDLVVFKGPEYRLKHEKVSIKAGHTSALSIKMKRWIDMPEKGWYSSDDHIHIARPDSTHNAGILAFTSAEDIHVANLLQFSNIARDDYYPQYAFGNAGQYRAATNHYLVSGQESPRTSHRGHTIGLNMNRFISNAQDYFIYSEIAKRVRAEGGLWGYSHVALDAFNVKYGLALDVPLGAVDFLEVLQMGYLNTQYLYDFLNLGYQVLPSAGSDYPYIHIAGSERIYAKVGDNFTPKTWFDAWKNKRSFVSNGPIIEFEVNGDQDTKEITLNRGDSLNVAAKALINPDIDSLDRLELVIQGEVVSRVDSASGSETLQLQHSFLPQNSAWAALRVYGKGNSVAHTAPFYIYIADQERRTWNKSLVPELAKRYIRILKEFAQSVPVLDEDWERFDTEQYLLPAWAASKNRLDAQISQANAAYEALIEDASK